MQVLLARLMLKLMTSSRHQDAVGDTKSNFALSRKMSGQTTLLRAILKVESNSDFNSETVQLCKVES